MFQRQKVENLRKKRREFKILEKTKEESFKVEKFIEEREREIENANICK